jgi:hypothetical protein
MHLRDFSASRNAGFVLAVSDLALIMLAAADESFAHEGINASASPTIPARAPSDSGG